MELVNMISWMIVLTSGGIVAKTSCPLHRVSCKNITTSSGRTIQQIPKQFSTMNCCNHDNRKHFVSSTSHVLCTIPSCLVSPCKNGGICLETEDSYTCVCPDGYFGDHCEDIPRTCAELKARNLTQDGTYVIDPDGPNGNMSVPIAVQCQDGITVIRHNVAGNRIVPQGYEEEGSYQQNVEYDVPMDAIIAVMMNSQSCRQYVRASCHNTFIYDLDGSQNVYWVSRQGTKMPNWGGVPSDTKGCLCGYQGECYDQDAPYCNCYRSQSVWLTDDGYLTDTDRLPVIRLHFGDTGDADEMMNYELGFLECE